MARKKVKLEFIESDTSRKVSYKKRVKGILKKTQELSVLCGVDACAVVYGPYDQAPVVWPSSEAEASRVLKAFQRKPDIDQSQRKLNQETFLKQSLNKAEEKLLRLQRKNREMEMEIVMSALLSGKPIQLLKLDDLGDLVWVIDDKMRSVQHRIRTLNGTDNSTQNPGAIVVANAGADADASANAGAIVAAGAGASSSAGAIVVAGAGTGANPALNLNDPAGSEITGEANAMIVATVQPKIQPGTPETS